MVAKKTIYLEAKRTTRTAVYDAKTAAELERFGNVLSREKMIEHTYLRGRSK